MVLGVAVLGLLFSVAIKPLRTIWKKHQLQMFLSAHRGVLERQGDSWSCVVGGDGFGNDELRELVSHLSNYEGRLELFLLRTVVSDDGLEYLTRLNRLELLWLRAAPVRGPGLRQLRDMSSLCRLILEEIPISEDDAEAICELGYIRELTIRNCGLTDKALLSIKKLASLERFWCEEDTVSDGATEWLKRARPNVEIVVPRVGEQ
jgi:hypothetical protein